MNYWNVNFDKKMYWFHPNFQKIKAQNEAGLLPHRHLKEFAYTLLSMLISKCIRNSSKAASYSSLCCVYLTVHQFFL